jgi:hypothetical protein
VATRQTEIHRFKSDHPPHIVRLAQRPACPAESLVRRHDAILAHQCIVDYSFASLPVRFRFETGQKCSKWRDFLTRNIIVKVQVPNIWMFGTQVERQFSVQNPKGWTLDFGTPWWRCSRITVRGIKAIVSVTCHAIHPGLKLINRQRH